ncbi:hypothetical protein POJ06DRAFT_239401 [Lipomyces tetrasporus]|uniref:Reverse transcriptase Ty1/copia-type domain-containing protein n=1 Tax=Lipomyces tetrasporus TaxID=54092 RepID=A0AAD7VQU4_9ASCO|nr:uncharacterized protein POJ06DRAFT_239401 [Lipomyces tetrasporus]KAJ8098498.1 hypothetical protein POJ06DRAFT_239401 [Lipomyces tetrasporus]
MVSGPTRRSTRVTRGCPPMKYGNLALDATEVTQAFVLAVQGVEHSDPQTFQEAVNGDHGQELWEAAQDEIRSLKSNETWSLVPRKQAENRKILSTKWVFE